MRLAAGPRSMVLVWVGLTLAASSVAARQKPAARPPSPAAGAAPPIAATPGAPPSKKERAVPFKVGETLEYDVSWSSFVVAGTATLKVLDKRASAGSSAYYIFAEGRPTPFVSRLYSLYYKADTLLDAYTLLPQRAAVYSDENGRQRMRVTLFDQARRTADYQVEAATPVKKRLTLSQGTLDLVSVLFVIRASPMVEGGRFAVPVVESGELYSVRVTAGGKEPIRTAAGTFSAWRIVPQVTDSDGNQVDNGLIIWISDDARRLPVKLVAELSVGQFVLLLRNVGL